MSITNLITPQWIAPSKVQSLITTRGGGVSLAPYATFNVATHVDDNLNLVMQNRNLLQQFLPSEPYWLNQTHSDKIICLDNIDPSTKTPPLDYDASFTQQKNKICAVMSADCIPILLTDKNASFVAAIHAGWRGIENNIIRNSILAVTTPSAHMLAYLGPAICKEHFEVGSDVFERFIRQDEDNKILFSRRDDGKFNCDLSAIAKMQLLKLGLTQQNIYLSNRCTFCEDRLFYSHRRDGLTGRIVSLIWICD